MLVLVLGGQTGANLETNYERDDRDTFLGSSISASCNLLVFVLSRTSARPPSFIQRTGDSSRPRLGAEDEDEVTITSQIMSELETRRQVITTLPPPNQSHAPQTADSAVTHIQEEVPPPTVPRGIAED